MQTIYELKSGYEVKIPLDNIFFGYHHGVIFNERGNVQVYQFGPEGTTLVPFEEFRNGKSLYVVSDKQIPNDVILQRVRDCEIWGGNYSFIFNNCEDFAKYITTGKYYS